MSKDGGLSRREVVIGGAAVTVGCQCGPSQFDDALVPVAHWPEEEPMTAPAPASLPYTNPLVLYGSVTVNPNTDGAVPNPSLSNPNGEPMELLEVRFRIVPQNKSGSASIIPAAMGLGLGVKMDLGKAAVVDSYVPVGDLGTSRDSYESQLGVYSAAAFGPAPGVQSLQNMYGWRLKYPLFIPGGSTLSCVLRPMGQNAYPVNVDVAYICRTWDPRKPTPTTVKVPWVTSYESKSSVYQDSAVAVQHQSSQLDIVNPFDAMLELARFGGRVSMLVNTSGLAFGDSVLEDPTTYRDVLATIRMRSSRGFDIVGAPVAFGGLFPYCWRAWDLPGKWLMAPREFYSTTIDVAAVSDSPEYVGQVQFSVGLTGYRNVPVSLLAE
jgi:hypothetical protein